MPLDLNDLPELTNAALDLVRVIRTSIDPDGERGKKVSRDELLAIMKASLRLLQEVVKALAD